MVVKNRKAILQFVVLLSIGILLIWLSLKQVAPEKDKIRDAFASADYFWISMSMLIAILSHFLRAYRWNYLLKPSGHSTDLFNANCHVIIGYFANYGIPRMGELTRCSLAAKYDKVPFEIGFGTVITERIVDFLIFFVIFILTLTLQFKELAGLTDQLILSKLRLMFSGISQSPLKLAAVIAVISLSIAAILFLRKRVTLLMKNRFGKILIGIGEGIGSISKLDRPFQFIFLSLLIWASYFYSLYVCFFALDGTSHLGQKECLTLLLFGTFGVVLAPGGLGAYPAILGGILLFTFRVDTASAFALPWLSWTSQFILVMVLGIIGLIVLPIYNRKKDVVSQAA